MTPPLPTILPPMRPRFAYDFPISEGRALELLRGIMDTNDHPIEGRSAGNHLMLVIPVKDRHFWSPWLNIETIKTDDPRLTTIKGRFSPNPSVWTGFMFLYSTLAVLGSLAFVFGLSQLVLQSTAWAFLLMIPAVLAAAALYWASLVGQHLAQNQMQLLYRVTLETLAQDAGIETLTENQP
ncbi:MAG: hypothetical protein JJ974_07905 [Phycisphaerales bacterium]|nr:hypothetical protein [Phycisphaerales bacterium]